MRLPGSKMSLMENLKKRQIKIDFRRHQVFELEIMATGYAIVVSTVTTIVCKFSGRRKLMQLKDDLSEVKASLLKAETEIRSLQITLGDQKK